MNLRLMVGTHRLTSVRSLALVAAILLALAFAASFVFDGPSALTQFWSKADYVPSGKIDGKLTIDGKATQLRYAYAQRDWLTSPMVDLIMTNRPLREDTLREIVNGRYRGSNKLIGLWLFFDSSGAYKGESLLLESGPVPAPRSYRSMTDGNTWIENDRITGKLDAKIESPTRTTVFSVSFDAPLKVTLPETGTTAVATSPEQFQTEFERVIPGKWSVERWRDSAGSFYTGILVVDEPPAGGEFKGTLHIAYLTDDRKIDEEVTISRDGTRVRMASQVARNTAWLLDPITLELEPELLVGGLTDSPLSQANVMLRKMP